MTSLSNAVPLVDRDLANYGFARFRDQVFDAVQVLWRRRQSEGWTQKRVAEAINRDPGWVSRNLRAPGNWTLRIIGELIQGLGGEAEIHVVAVEDPPQTPSNFDAYDGYVPPQVGVNGGSTNTATIAPTTPQIFTENISDKTFMMTGIPLLQFTIEVSK